MTRPLRPPMVRPTIPPGVVPGERRITWDSLIGKPTTLPDSGIAIALSDLPQNATATREFLRSVSGASAWDLLALADLPTNGTVTRKFLRSVSSTAAVWDTLTAADIAAGTFGGGAYDGPTTLSVATAYKVAGIQVLAARHTGWSAWTGTPDRTTHATYSDTAGVAYSQTQIQSLMDAVKQVTQTAKALLDDLTTHGVIGP